MVRPHHHYTWETHTITGTGLRKIHLPPLVRLAILAALHRPPPRRGRPRPRDPEADPPALEEWAELYAHETVAARRSRPRLDDDHFRDVAGIYRSALGDGLDPVAQVKAAFSVARSTAGRWVVEARKRGHLGPTTRGKAGELRPPKASRRRKASGRGRTR